VSAAVQVVKGVLFTIFVLYLAAGMVVIVTTTLRACRGR
jgi:hypothetical protein